MRQFTFQPIAILALNAGHEEHERSILKVNGFNAIKPLLGVYKGQEERAWLVCISTPEEKEAVVNLAGKYDQDSVLFSGIDRTCTLRYLDEREDNILGVLKEVPEVFAKTQDSYTYDAKSDQYFVAL